MITDIDIVIPLRDRPSLYNDKELSYCLRSIERFFPVRDVWMIGEPRPYLSCNWIEMSDGKGSRHESVRQKIMAACENPYISDPFVLFNDDFVLTREITMLHDYYDGTIEKRLKTAGGEYRERMLESQELSKDGLNYEVHVPALIDKDLFKKTKEGSLYRNVCLSHSKREKVEIRDPKMYTKDQHSRGFIRSHWCISLSEASIPYVHRELDRMFPEKSKWE